MVSYARVIALPPTLAGCRSLAAELDEADDQAAELGGLLEVHEVPHLLKHQQASFGNPGFDRARLGVGSRN